MSTQNTAEHYMRYVLALAAEALDQGEFPIASIVVLDEQIIAQATASEQREKRFLGHAELVALEEADKQQLSFAERGRARLFTNLEPCLMCMGAAMSLNSLASSFDACAGSAGPTNPAGRSSGSPGRYHNVPAE